MKDKMLKRALLRVGAVLLIAFGAAWHYGWVHPQYWFRDYQVNTIVTQQCDDLVAGCRFRLENHDYVLKSRGPVTTKAPVELVLSGKADKVGAEWAMAGMDMGSARYALQRDGESWQASTILPVCSQKRQDWQLTLDIDRNRIVLLTRSRP
ncbi:hypothetical protein [Jeongeupia chitinilytica]|uniref:Uncharacterized protein n=1 Tax=Jeongeupia chitinilytica TaxID=1041641 RepID=A0ABQ3H2W1_9NEIS|nr:hypothetical protein [Jeongeupia chitinilytica]GHD65927.1 hypothetical protein GCM10007350_27270 [Jeongeupia chitinilytica]